MFASLILFIKKSVSVTAIFQNIEMALSKSLTIILSTLPENNNFKEAPAPPAYGSTRIIFSSS